MRLSYVKRGFGISLYLGFSSVSSSIGALVSR